MRELYIIYLNGQEIGQYSNTSTFYLPDFVSSKEKQAITDCFNLLIKNQPKKEWIKLKNNTTISVRKM